MSPATNQITGRAARLVWPHELRKKPPRTTESGGDVFFAEATVGTGCFYGRIYWNKKTIPKDFHELGGLDLYEKIWEVRLR